jgi:hypothetical protein
MFQRQRDGDSDWEWHKDSAQAGSGGRGKELKEVKMSIKFPVSQGGIIA